MMTCLRKALRKKQNDLLMWCLQKRRITGDSKAFGLNIWIMCDQLLRWGSVGAGWPLGPRCQTCVAVERSNGWLNVSLMSRREIWARNGHFKPYDQNCQGNSIGKEVKVTKGCTWTSNVSKLRKGRRIWERRQRRKLMGSKKMSRQ